MKTKLNKIAVGKIRKTQKARNEREQLLTPYIGDNNDSLLLSGQSLNK